MRYCFGHVALPFVRPADGPLRPPGEDDPRRRGAFRLRGEGCRAPGAWRVRSRNPTSGTAVGRRGAFRLPTAAFGRGTSGPSAVVGAAPEKTGPCSFPEGQRPRRPAFLQK
ncbi:hypothetical protein B005_3328 [Nocardiopsis alba ATCC BAA-2165]|uniref:Uncharacterized protein n=1 Tax=Nocardiopsis alba (strain ATCC BAA-2165 / BE74) TaxID=1205910 RepID=J7LA67_NOCAA|nr:hypothetical protein B005_3328 [Nocardiopsis alba ATCC BAA-2165]